MAALELVRDLWTAREQAPTDSGNRIRAFHFLLEMLELGIDILNPPVQVTQLRMGVILLFVDYLELVIQILEQVAFVMTFFRHGYLFSIGTYESPPAAC
jgi:hypothetical protein